MAKSSVHIDFVREEDPRYDIRQLIAYNVAPTADIDGYARQSENFYSPYILPPPPDWVIVFVSNVTNSALTADFSAQGITRLVVFVAGLSTRYFPVKNLVYTWQD
jgi:hypothetical protein